MRSTRLRPGPRLARRQRGAAVFVVVLVISLLSALGLFAVRSSTTAVAASGYQRQLNAVHQLTDLAITAAVAVAGENPEAVKQQLMKGPDVGGGDATCLAFSLQTKPSCFLMSYDDINSRVQSANGTAALVGELGRLPYAGVRPLDQDMRIELTDLHPSRPVRGNEAAGGADATVQLRYAYVTVSATSIVRPQQASAGTWDTESAAAAGIETSRAHVGLGPVLIPR
ncbi:MAG: hypothetical protein AAGA56_13690 [Myxococcota bacterium]